MEQLIIDGLSDINNDLSWTHGYNLQVYDEMHCIRCFSINGVLYL